ncbi:hypothetical protein Lal_00029325 [Lupinus albus]|nr:hypothetical protein Lal_00029325 [Lupinus albus]
MLTTAAESSCYLRILEQRGIDNFKSQNSSEFSKADSLKAALAEFISMLIFVFAREGSVIAYSKAL